MPRKTKKVDEQEEEENRKALDAAAGVAQPASVKTVEREVTRPANAMPLLKPDTREKLLYKTACTGTPLGSDFFDVFPDRQELLDLAFSISVRLLIVAICNSEVSPAQRISAMRLVAALNGKQLPATEEADPTTRPAPPLAIPTGAVDDLQKSLDKFRELSKAS
jgi:hypothetical protein